MAESEQQGEPGSPGLPMPDASATLSMPVVPGDSVFLDFDPNQVEISLRGSDLVFVFENGGRIILQGFAIAADTDEPPSLMLSTGEVLAGDVVVEQLADEAAEDDPEPLETAAGEPESGEPGEDGVQSGGSSSAQSIAELVSFIEFLVLEGAVRDSAFASQPGPPALLLTRDDVPSVVQVLASASPQVPLARQVANVDGTTLDGYFVGATVFADVDEDFTLGDGEISVRTGDLGTFDLQPFRSIAAPLVMENGTDVSLQVPFATKDDDNSGVFLDFRGSLRAPAGSEVITPLTTLVADLTDPLPPESPDQSKTLAQAEWIIVEALDLGTRNPPELPEDLEARLTSFDSSLRTVDPKRLLIGDTGDSANVRLITAPEVQVAAAKVLNTVTQVASLLIGLSGRERNENDFDTEFSGVFQTVFLKLTENLVERTKQNVAVDGGDPLVDHEFIKALIANSAKATDLQLDGSKLSELTEDAGDLIVAINEQADAIQQPDSGPFLDLSVQEVLRSANGFLKDVAQVSTVAQTDRNAISNDNLVGENPNALQEGAAGTLRMSAMPGQANTITSFKNELDGRIDNVVPGDVGTAADDEVSGSNENDRLLGYDGNDLIIAGGGNDTLFGGNGNDQLFGQSGDDSLDGSDGSDELFGDVGADTLFGGDGNDVLVGERDNDKLFGGAGSDTFVFDFGDDTKSSRDIADQEVGADTIEGAEATRDKLQFKDVFLYAGDSLLARLDSSAAWGDGWRVSDDGIDVTVTFGDNDGDGHPDLGLGSVMIQGIGVANTGPGAINTFAKLNQLLELVDNEISGTSGNDPLRRGDGGGNDVLKGLEGDDTLDGGDGDDELFGGPGSDTHFGGAGDDVMGEPTPEGSPDGSDTHYGGAGDDFSFGRGEADFLFGGADRDVLFGGNGSDHLDGGDGDDVLDGNAGDDYLKGGAGNDQLLDRFMGFGNDTLEGGAGGDLLDGGEGSDTAVYRNSDAGVDIDLGGRGIGGDGTHRLRLVWDATAETATFSIDQDHTGGAFLADRMGDPVNGGDNGFDATNARIFFGGASGVTFDDFTVAAVIPIAEDFSGGVLPPTLEHNDPTDPVAPTFEEEMVVFSDVGDSNRSYLRTVETSYASVSFVAEVTVTVDSSANPQGGSAAAFFGLGKGDLADFGEPRDLPHIFARVLPDNFFPRFDAVDNKEEIGIESRPRGGDAEGDRLVSIENLIGSAHGDRLSGGGDANTLDGGAGDDRLDGGGGNDFFDGGAGDDRLEIGDAGFQRIDGGAGDDTLVVDFNDDLDLDLTQIDNDKLRDIERIELTGSGSNTLTLTLADVVDLTGEQNDLLVVGDATDTVSLADDGWSPGTPVEIEGVTFVPYHNGAATVRVESEIQADVS